MNLPPLLAIYDGADYEQRDGAVWRICHATGCATCWCAVCAWPEAQARLEMAAAARRTRIRAVMVALGPAPPPPAPAVAKKRGGGRALREAAIAVDNTLIHAGHFEPETGATSCRKLLDLPLSPSAIFVANHEATLGVLRVTAERNLSIPADLSLLCYEDMPWFAWHRPAISIVDNGARDLANLAVDRLLQRMEAKENGDSGVREYRVGARLVKRDSCRQIEAPKPAKPRSTKPKSSASKA